MHIAKLFGASLLLIVSAWSMPVAQAYQQESVYVRCESIRGRDNHCPVDTRGEVQLVDQLSDSLCVEGNTWGTDRGGIWVRGGCRADFEVTSGRRGRSWAGGGERRYDSGRRGGTRVICESLSRRTARCAVRVRNEVELVEQLSSDECRFDWSWGYDERGIWVAHGCRAEFIVY